MRLVLWCSLACLTSGCGNSGPEIIPIDTAPVSGVATYEGKALEDYRIFFFNKAHPAQEPATARIDADGKFTLSIRDPGDGAMIGANQIWFSYDPVLPEEVPGREVGLAPPPPKVQLPREYLNSETSKLSVDVPKEGLNDYQVALP